MTTSTGTRAKGTRAAGGSAAGRRLRFGARSLVLLASVTASCLFAGLIASRFPVRLDATASREHLLSERTLRTLGGLEGTYEIVVAANRRSVEPRAFERARDVLDSFARESEHVRVTFIDTGSSSGIASYDALLKRLSEQYKEEIEGHRAAVARALETAGAQQEVTTTLAADIAGVKEGVRGTDITAEQLRQLLEDYAARARVAAFNLKQATDGANRALLETIGPLSLVPLDEVAAHMVKASAGVTSDLSRLLREMKLVDQARDIPGDVKDRVRPIVPAIQASLDTLRGMADGLERLPKLPILPVARTLDQSSAALVIGPPGKRRGAGNGGHTITAIEFGSLFPPALPEGAVAGVTLDQRARAEELAATAIASLNATVTPVVVLVHDQAARQAPVYERYAAMVDRLGLRGIDVMEWAVALDAEPPSLAAAASGGPGGEARPVVYVTQTTAPNTAEGADRMRRMARAMGRLVTEGKPVLMSVNVSTLPGIGEADPLVDVLSPLGIKVDSGRPLMQRVQTPSGPVVLTDFLPRRATGEHPISRAIDGLGVHVFWPVSIQQSAETAGDAGGSAAGRATVTPIVQIEGDGNTWAESEWLGYLRVPTTQRKTVIDPPAPDSPRDDASGRWAVAATAERPHPSAAGQVQRLAIVGCAGWFLDDVTQQSVGVIDGRPVLSSPGNLELLEAAVLWLAGQEEMIARSPTAQAAPLIRSLTAAQTQAVRWSLFAGMPALVLVIGGAWRMAWG